MEEISPDEIPNFDKPRPQARSLEELQKLGKPTEPDTMILPCRMCGQLVLPSAKHCPRCGAKSSHAWMRYLTVAILVAAFVGLCIVESQLGILLGGRYGKIIIVGGLVAPVMYYLTYKVKQGKW